MAANESYHVTPAPVKVEFLSDPLRATYDLICDLAERTGKCYACAAWLSHRLGITEGQLSRRLKQLRGFGLLVIEHIPGLRRLLVPCKPDADSPPLVERVIEKQHTAPPPKMGTMVPKPAEPVVAPSDEEATPAVHALTQQGVSAPIAAALVKQKGPKACLTQVEALARRSNVRDAAAVLVASIQGDWAIPSPKRKPKVYFVRRPQKPQEEAGPLDVRSMLRGLKRFTSVSSNPA